MSSSNVKAAERALDTALQAVNIAKDQRKAIVDAVKYLAREVAYQNAQGLATAACPERSD